MPTADLDPLTASFLEDPYPLYRQLRDEEPVYRRDSARGSIWLLTRHDDIATALADWETFSSVPGEGLPQSAFAARNIGGGTQLIESDPPLHDQLRETVQARFSPKRIRELEASFREAASRLIDDVNARTSFDVAREFAWPLTLRVISDMVGIPEEDRSMVLDWYLDIIYSETQETSSDSALHYGGYFSRLASERLSRPTDDLMSDLMRQTEAGAIRRADAVLLCMDLFEGGVDVPANLIGNSVLALADHPEQRATLADPELEASKLRIAIEELARFDAPIQYLPRTTAKDVSLHGTTIPRGSRVRLVLGSANRDERHYREPDRLDLSRPPLRGVAFGVGVHFCIGAPLARLGVGVALPMLLRAIPSYEIVGPVERPRGADLMRALLRLDVDTGANDSERVSTTGLTVVVDMDRCDSHGQCMLAAPAVFELDDDLNLHYVAQPPEELRADVGRAVQLCPMQAIRVEN